MVLFLNLNCLVVGVYILARGCFVLKFVQSEGALCRLCNKRFSVRRYETGKTTILCGCGCLIISKRGAWSFISQNKYSKAYAHLRSAKSNENANVSIEERTTPKESQACAKLRAGKLNK